MSTSIYNATITARSDLTEALAFFRVRTDDEPRPFTAGQYFTLGLLAGGRLVQRPYSAASSPDRLLDDYEFYIRLVPGGALTPRLFETRPGDRISITGPKGRFRLHHGEERLHLFVATGCGVAPFISMLRSFRDETAPLRCVLLHGVSYARELAYRLFLEDWAAERRNAFSYIPTISRPAAPENAGWTGSTGRVESVIGRVCEERGISASDALAYVCGNPEMTVAVKEALRGRGFGDQQIRTEDYWPLRPKAV
jgi:ferredoxin-NADP reductase